MHSTEYIVGHHLAVAPLQDSGPTFLAQRGNNDESVGQPGLWDLGVQHAGLGLIAVSDLLVVHVGGNGLHARNSPLLDALAVHITVIREGRG
jgi:hypothetical protein